MQEACVGIIMGPDNKPSLKDAGHLSDGKLLAINLNRGCRHPFQDQLVNLSLAGDRLLAVGDLHLLFEAMPMGALKIVQWHLLFSLFFPAGSGLGRIAEEG